jgi:hypothetical protein
MLIDQYLSFIISTDILEAVKKSDSYLLLIRIRSKSVKYSDNFGLMRRRPIYTFSVPNEDGISSSPGSSSSIASSPGSS